jgi:hypothetical protein
VESSILNSLVVQRGLLTAVVDVDMQLPRSCLCLRFEEGATIVWVTDDDSLLLADLTEADIGDASTRDEIERLKSGDWSGVQDLRRMEPWASLIGSLPSWAWILDSNLGFEDGLQIEFVDPDGRTVRTIQLMTGGGTLGVSDVTPI